MGSKKKMWCILLCICLIVVMLPATALANPQSYEVWVGGIEVTSDNADQVMDGVSYNAATNTLKLNGASLTSIYDDGNYNGAAIYAKGDLKLSIQGKNTIKLSDSASSNSVFMYMGIYTTGGLTIQGTGLLDIDVAVAQNEKINYGIDAEGGNITIEGGNVSVYASGTNGFGIHFNGVRSVVMKGGSLEAAGNGTMGDGYAIQPCTTGTVDLSQYGTANILAGASANGSDAQEKEEWELAYGPYGYIKITPYVIQYDENGFSADGKYYEPAVLKDGFYQIKNAGNLFWFSEHLAEDDSHIDANAKLTQDITIPQGKDFVPISAGPYGTGYSGTFDGQNHTITGLCIQPKMGYSATGLFRTVSQGGTVRDLTLTDLIINAPTSTLGGICGKNRGTITNCHVTGNVKTSLAYADFIGGIAGSNAGSISHCSNEAEILGTNGSIGGISGELSTGGTITNCYNTGNIKGSFYVGGICGNATNGNQITNCYNTGNVSANTGYEFTAKGIAYLGGGTSCTAEQCYYLADASTGDGGRTAAQFASGEVAYLLNNSLSEGDLVWGQTLSGTEAQSAPVFDGKTVYVGYAFCYSTEISYGNDKESLFDTIPAHQFTGEWKSSAEGHWKMCQNTGCTASNSIQSHTPAQKLVNVVAPTATQQGYSGDTVCSICGWILEKGHYIEKLAPSITQGEQSQYEKGDLNVPSFTSDAALEDFIRVEVDGQEIPTEHYTVTGDENGITVTLTPEYLETLSEGTHFVGIVSQTGTARAELTIKAGETTADTEDEAADSPSTGDRNLLALWISLSVLAVAALASLLWLRKKWRRDTSSLS